MTSAYLNTRLISVFDTKLIKDLEPLRFNVINCKAIAKINGSDWETVMRTLATNNVVYAGTRHYRLTKRW